MAEDKKPVVENEWMIRDCKVYDEEYSDCTSIKGRLHQMFVFGTAVDCTQWKRDATNCYKWTGENDIKAAKELIESESQRRKDRLIAHHNNDIWTKRKTPPENWDAPLPEEMQKEYETTYLYVKSQELKGETPPGFDSSGRYCVIS